MTMLSEHPVKDLVLGHPQHVALKPNWELRKKF